MGQNTKVIFSRSLGAIALLIALKLAFYRNGKPIYVPHFDESVYVLFLIGITLFYIDRFEGIIKHFRVSKIKFTPVELEINSVENILGVGDEIDDPREKLGLLELVSKAFEDIDRELTTKVNSIDDKNLTELKASINTISEKQMAFLYLKFKDVRPELVSAFLQLRVKRLDLLVNEKKLKSTEIIKIIGLCYQILAELRKIGDVPDTSIESIG